MDDLSQTFTSRDSQLRILSLPYEADIGAGIDDIFNERVNKTTSKRWQLR